MGVFNLFGRGDKSRTGARVSDFELPNGENDTVARKNPITVFKPTSFNDVESIIDCVKLGKSAVVHLTAVKTETAIRVLDMLSGAIYALNGGVYEMEKNIFMFSPQGVEIL